MSWNGEERRKQMIDVGLEVRQLAARFDNELGAANGSHEGTVKKSLRDIQESIKNIEKVIVGDGDKPGISEKVNTVTKSFNEHVNWDRWLFGILISGQVIGLYKQFNP